MEQEIQQLREDITILTNRIAELEKGLTYSGMSFELKEVIRTQIFKGVDTLGATTRSQTVAIGDLPVVLTIPSTPSGILVLTDRAGKEYKVPIL